MQQDTTPTTAESAANTRSNNSSIEKRYRDECDIVKKFSYGSINNNNNKNDKNNNDNDNIDDDDEHGNEHEREKEFLLEFENMEANETKDYMLENDELLDNEVFLSTQDRRESLEEMEEAAGRVVSIDRTNRTIASYLFWSILVIFLIVLAIRIAYVDNIII